MLILKALLVPLEQLLHTFVNLNLVRPAKAVQFLHVNELAHSAIGLASIKGYFALKAYGLDNELGELTDGQFLASAHIDVAVANLAQAGYISTAALSSSRLTRKCIIDISWSFSIEAYGSSAEIVSIPPPISQSDA